MKTSKNIEKLFTKDKDIARDDFIELIIKILHDAKEYSEVKKIGDHLNEINLFKTLLGSLPLNISNNKQAGVAAYRKYCAEGKEEIKKYISDQYCLEKFAFLKMFITDLLHKILAIPTLDGNQREVFLYYLQKLKSAFLALTKHETYEKVLESPPEYEVTGEVISILVGDSGSDNTVQFQVGKKAKAIRDNLKKEAKDKKIRIRTKHQGDIKYQYGMHSPYSWHYQKLMGNIYPKPIDLTIGNHEKNIGHQKQLLDKPKYFPFFNIQKPEERERNLRQQSYICADPERLRGIYNSKKITDADWDFLESSSGPNIVIPYPCSREVNHERKYVEFKLDSNSYVSDFLNWESNPSIDNQASWLFEGIAKYQDYTRALYCHHPFSNYHKNDTALYITDPLKRERLIKMGIYHSNYGALLHNVLLKQIELMQLKEPNFTLPSPLFDLIVAGHRHYAQFSESKGENENPVYRCQFIEGRGGGTLNKPKIPDVDENSYINEHGCSVLSYKDQPGKKPEIEITTYNVNNDITKTFTVRTNNNTNYSNINTNVSGNVGPGQAHLHIRNSIIFENSSSHSNEKQQSDSIKFKKAIIRACDSYIKEASKGWFKGTGIGHARAIKTLAESQTVEIQELYQSVNRLKQRITSPNETSLMSYICIELQKEFKLFPDAIYDINGEYKAKFNLAMTQISMVIGSDNTGVSNTQNI